MKITPIAKGSTGEPGILLESKFGTLKMTIYEQRNKENPKLIIDFYGEECQAEFIECFDGGQRICVSRLQGKMNDDKER